MELFQLVYVAKSREKQIARHVICSLIKIHHHVWLVCHVKKFQVPTLY